jgi:hypothetical protein
LTWFYTNLTLFDRFYQFSSFKLDFTCFMPFTSQNSFLTTMPWRVAASWHWGTCNKFFKKYTLFLESIRCWCLWDWDPRWLSRDWVMRCKILEV